MHLSRPSRLIAAFIALLSMLFMQLAIAGYSCPDLNVALASDVAVTSDAAASMPGCLNAGLDKEQPSLCSAHAQLGNQSLNNAALPDVQPFVATTLKRIFEAILQSDSDPIDVRSDTVLLTRITAPPLAIRHCCFRI